MLHKIIYDDKKLEITLMTTGLSGDPLDCILCRHYKWCCINTFTDIETFTAI